MNNHRWTGKAGKEEIVAGTFYEVAGPADYYVDRMNQATLLFKKALAAEFAIKEDPGCIEAHLFFGRQLKDPDDAMEHLEHAVAMGEALWAPAAMAEGEDMPWWGCLATRPYMRAIHALGLAHLQSGNDDQARSCFERLLEMNPNDNQGIRYLLDDIETNVSLVP